MLKRDFGGQAKAVKSDHWTELNWRVLSRAIQIVWNERNYSLNKAKLSIARPGSIAKT